MLTRRLRQQAEKLYLAKKILLVVVSILCMCFLVWEYSSLVEEVLPVNGKTLTQQGQYRVLQLPTWREVLFLGIPRLISATEPKVVVKEKTPSNSQQVFREIIMFFTNVDIKDMRSLLQAEIPVLAGNFINSIRTNLFFTCSCFIHSSTFSIVSSVEKSSEISNSISS